MAKSALFVAAVGLTLVAAQATRAEADQHRQMARACAVSDLQAINIIEDEGPRVSGSAVEAAFRALVKARGACADGRHLEGIAVYDTISLMSATARASTPPR